MKMRQFVLGLSALPLLASVVVAGQPALLSDKQMDQVTAGFTLFVVSNIELEDAFITANGYLVDIPALDGMAGQPSINPAQIITLRNPGKT